MAYPSLGTTEWNELSSAYLNKTLSRELRDQYTKKHPLLVWLRSKQSTEDTAAKWTWPVYDGSAAVGRSYTGTQGHTPQDVKVATTAEQDCAFWAEPIVFTHTDEQRTKGSGKTFDLLAAKRTHAMRRVTDKHSALIWSSTQVNVTDPTTIRLAIPIDPTASTAFHNINPSSGNQTWWRNKTQTSTGSYSTDGINKLDTAINDMVEDSTTGMPELLVTTKAVFNFMQRASRGYMNLQSALMTKAGKQMADLGIPILSHNGIPVVHDSDCTTGCIYGVHSDAIEWVANEGGDYTLMGDGFESMRSTGVMAVVAYLRLEGNLRVTERRALLQVDGITAA